MPVDSWNVRPNTDDDFLPDYRPLCEQEIECADDSPSEIGTLKQSSDVPFLFLLGRPGSGKSRELQQARKQGWFGLNCRWIEGKEFGSDIAGTLDRVVGSSNEPVRLILDGLDEALLERGPNFVPQLKRWILDRRGPHGEPAIRLTITCRWADWPVQNVSELAALWPSNHTRFLMLCPLRRKEAVQTIERAFGPSAELFWGQLQDRHLQPVACWPEGLLGLMAQFEASGRTSVSDGYSQVIEHQVTRFCQLADSPNDAGRWQAAVKGVEWRRKVAGRLAAAMIWSGKNRLNLELTGPDNRFVTISDFHGQSEFWENGYKSILLEDLDDVARGKSRLMRALPLDSSWVFGSQVQQEFLAAEWLAEKELDESRLKQIFGHEKDGRWRVQPALGAVAAWLACRQPAFRRLVLDHDALVMLRMDGSRLAASDRYEIVEALLEATERIQILDPAIRQSHLASLAHPQLHAQIERWLVSPDVSGATKELALDIASKTRLYSMASVLWRLYLKESDEVRIKMAHALYRLAQSPEHDKMWLSVLRGEVPIDGYGTLLGAALHLLIVSRKRPLRESLPWIVPKRRFEVYGLYEQIVRQLPEHLTPADLPAVLAKLGERPDCIIDLVHGPQRLHKDSVRLAIRHFDNTEIAEALSGYWHQCLAQHIHPHHDLNCMWESEDLGFRDKSHRRSIVHALIHHPGFEIHTEKKWLTPSDYLITDDDLEWFLDEITGAVAEDRWRWALVLASVLWRVDLNGKQSDRIQRVWESMPEVRSYFPQPAAGETIQDALQRMRTQSRAKREADIANSRTQRAERAAKFQEDLQKYTQQCKLAHQAGKLTWGGVFDILSARTHGPGSSMVTFEPIGKIGPEDDWMIEAAARHLRELPNQRPIVFGDGLDGLLALAACLPRLSGDSDLLSQIGKHWLAAMLADFSMSYMENVPEGIGWKQFAELFPDEFAGACDTVIRHRYLNGGELGELDAFADCWSPTSSEKLTSLLKHEPIQVAGFFNAIRYLAEQNELMAIDVIRFWLENVSCEWNAEQKAVLAGAALFLLNGRMVCDALDSRILDDLDVSRNAIWRSVHRLGWHPHKIDFLRWSDSSVEGLATVCWKAYTSMNRSFLSGRNTGFVSGEDEAIEFRDRITSEATQRGIELNLPGPVCDDTPEETRLRLRQTNWHRHNAAAARLKASRSFLSPRDLFKVCATPDARLARDADELLAAVVASVQRWEEALIAGNWQRVWDLKPLRPRDEENIANELRDWLRDELKVVSEREPELRSERRSDIIVQTLTPTGAKITVVLELKRVRPKNAKERREEMRTKLRDVYLKQRANEGWTHGLYVVVWTPESGHKLDSDAAMEAEAKSLQEQAKSLSEPPFVLTSIVVDARSRL
jgi:hypothetical protein